MRKKSETTIIERALEYVSGFDRVFQIPEASAEGGFTGSMQKYPSLHNYIHCVAAISLHFVRLP